MEALTNDRWGLESNCFVCESRNEAGLRIPFFHDPEEGVVTATWSLDQRFSGAPSYVHGGVLLAILDEAMAWATIAEARRWAMTGETTTRFERPVQVGETYVVTARVVDAPTEGSATIGMAATITGTDGDRYASARATFVILGEAQVVAAAGGPAPDLSQGDLRGR